jgi:hypothetical protein
MDATGLAISRLSETAAWADVEARTARARAAIVADLMVMVFSFVWWTLVGCCVRFDDWKLTTAPAARCAVRHRRLEMRQKIMRKRKKINFTMG